MGHKRSAKMDKFLEIFSKEYKKQIGRAPEKLNLRVQGLR